VRLHGLLSFYDEPPASLTACIKGLSDAGVSELVAVDGAYGLYPDGRPASHPNQHAAIVLACRELGMGCTLHVPRKVWAGNEIEKRTFLFRLAYAAAEPGDWFWVMDADQVVQNAPDDLLERLQATEHPAAAVEFLDTVALRANQANWPPRFECRDLFRADDIRVETNHCTYVAGDGRLLWGGNGDVKREYAGAPLEPCLDLTRDVLVEHRPDRRPPERQHGKLVYYNRRDEERAERGHCGQCGQQAERLVATKWRMTRLGPVAKWVEACEPCAERLEAVGRRQLLQLGVDPDTVKVENRNGHAPAGMAVR
jgi:hypothetical protein